MNQIQITGKISSMYPGSKDTGKPLNLYVIDDELKSPIIFHSAFWNDDDLEKLKNSQKGDEISLIGAVTGFSSQYKYVEVRPAEITSIAEIKREVKYTRAGTSPSNMSVEAEKALPKNEKE